MGQRIGAIVVARMGSSRLPEKVLKTICGKTVLEHVIERLGRVDRIEQIVVATTRNPLDDAIADLCRQRGLTCFRGDEENVLERTIEAVMEHKLDIVIRMGADSPLLDWQVIDEMLSKYLQKCDSGNRLEYLSNTLDRSYPIGLDAEIFAAETFERIDRETRDLPAEQRRLNEINVVPYLHQNLDLFRTYSFTKDFDFSDLRWTLDTPEDFDLITRVYEAVYPRKQDFLMGDVLELMKENPDWIRINSDVVPVSGYWTAIEQQKFSERNKQRK